MKIKRALKIMTLALTLVLAFTFILPIAAEARWAALCSVGRLIDYEKGISRMCCSGYTLVWGNNEYKAEVVVELLMEGKNDTWNTIMIWTDGPTWNYASLTAYWYVLPGFAYMVRTTHIAYNPNGTVKETFTDTSRIIYT